MAFFRKYSWLLVALALATLTLLFFHRLALTDMILARGDTFTYFYPYWEARNAALRAGELPLWTPDLFAGVPLLANPQLGTYYPPNWLTVFAPVPDAYKWSAIAHVGWAALGTMLLYRGAIDDEMPLAALLAGAVYGLGGYVGAHIEQINQVQGLAWLPWLLWLLHRARTSERYERYGLLLALAWTLQLLSGHTQTVFMSGIALGVYALWWGWQADYRLRAIGQALLLVGGAALLTLLLALPQIVPTLELAALSSRSGGFDVQAATAFSLSPLYIGQALLPNLDSLLFTEYISTIGLVALGLALLGALQSLTQAPRQHGVWVLLAALGLFFALGRFNPLYVLLANLPGFDLFRVPARWMALFALSAALLSGLGCRALVHQQVRRWHIGASAAALALLMLVGALAPVAQADVVGAARVSSRTLLLWGGSLVAFVALTLGYRWQRVPRLALIVITLGLIVSELFIATRILPYNDAVPRDVYAGKRFTVSQMQVYADEQFPAGRTLSISRLRFDPGDNAQLRQYWQRAGLDERAIQTAFTATKQQDVLAPNLPLTWDIPTLDGYGGGVLPTTYYSSFTSLLLPPQTTPTVDGRIGEILAQPACSGACVPDLQALHLADVRYLIVDKVFDVSHEGVRYDTTLAQEWRRGVVDIDFAYTHLYLLHRGTLPGIDIASEAIGDMQNLTRLPREQASQLSAAVMENIIAITAVDDRTGAFVEMQPSGWERVLSSDVKVYAVPTNPRSRVYLAGAQIMPDERAIATLREPSALPVIHADNIRPLAYTGGTAEIIAYTPTRIEIAVTADDESYLYLHDAYYPGWQATVNGTPTDMYRANIMFRAVPVPAGESRVIFAFQPQRWWWALWGGGVVWIIVLLGLAWGSVVHRRENSNNAGS